MKRVFVSYVILIIVLSSCSLAWLFLSKKIINHPQPKLTINNSYFDDLGCFNDTSCLPADLKQIKSPIGYISEPSKMLGGLDPVYPIALAATSGFRDQEEIPAVYVNRCMANQYMRYLVIVDGNMQLVDSKGQMAALYAPIESENEALSYAIAITGFSAVYDLNKLPRPKLYGKVIEETCVSEKDGVYQVHLFNTYLCGCGPHINRAVDVTVRKDGAISISEFTEAYSDPKLDGMCID